MEILIKQKNNSNNETSAKLEVLNYLENQVKEWMAVHVAKRKLWFSNDYLPADEQFTDDQESDLKKLRNRVRGIKDQVRVSVALNLLTEEGLPHFHRILAKHLGSDSFWSKWNNMWTGEEDRHGCVLRDYARDGRLFNFRELELLQYRYQETGFNPDWDMDPYKVFVYTTLQEKATQISHKNTGKLAGEEEPLLENILDHVAADEAKHYTFYRNVFKAILDLDPNRALLSAANIMPSIEMPGYLMPGFRDIADVVRRTGIYGPRDYKKIVEEVIKFWNIEILSGLNEAALKAQEKIMSIPKRLEKVAEYIEQRTGKKTFSFDFIYNRILVFE